MPLAPHSAMLRCLPILLFAVWALAFASDRASAADPVYPKGLRIGLTPVGDLKPSTRFPGFEDTARGVQVSMLELPPPAAEEIARSIFAQQQIGLADVRRESFPFQDGVGFLVSAHGETNGVK